MWLRQQHEPEAILTHLHAIRLSGEGDFARLSREIQAVLETMPDAGQVYAFDDDHGLIRKPAATRAMVLAHAASEADATVALLDEQARPFDTGKIPPLRVALYLIPQGAVIGILHHRMLDERFDPVRFVADLGGALNGNSPESYTPPPAFYPVDEPGTTGAGSLAALFALPPGVNISSPDMAVGEAARSAHALRRLRAEMPQSVMALPADRPSVDVVAEAFGRLLCQLQGIAAGRLSVGRSEDSDLALALCRSALRDFDVSLEAETGTTPQMLGAGVIELAPPLLPDLQGNEARQILLPCQLDLPGLWLGLCLQGDSITLDLIGPADLPSGADRFILGQLIARLSAGQQVGLRLPAAIASTGQAGGTGETAGRGDAVLALILEEFRQALSAPDLGPQDDFFDYGGHSLVATRIIGRLQSQHGLSLRLNDIFEHPTAEALAVSISGRGDLPAEAARVDLVDVAVDADAPLSLAQESLWKAWSKFGFGAAFNIPFGLRFEGPVDEEAFREAFTDILVRHPVLRSRFFETPTGITQRAVPPEELPAHRWFWTSAESADADYASEAGHVFDLTRELPLRLRFMTGPDGGRILSMLFHHLVIDEWSVNLMMDELATAYAARAAGRVPEFGPAPPAFAEFARQQRAQDLNRDHLDYWTSRLHNAPAPRPILQGAAAEPGNTAGGWVEITFEPDLAEALHRCAREHNASLFNLVYAAIGATLMRLGGIDDLVIGTSASGRNDAAYFDSIGYFTTVVAHRLRLDAATTPQGLIAQVRETINGSLPYSDIPIDLVEEALAQGKPASPDHIFEAFIQLHAQNRLNGTLQGPDGQEIRFHQIDPEKHESVLGLQFEVLEDGLAGDRRLRIMLSYRSAHYSPAQIRLIEAALRDMLARFSDPSRAGQPIPALSAEVAS